MLFVGALYMEQVLVGASSEYCDKYREISLTPSMLTQIRGQ